MQEPRVTAKSCSTGAFIQNAGRAGSESERKRPENAFIEEGSHKIDLTSQTLGLRISVSPMDIISSHPFQRRMLLPISFENPSNLQYRPSE